MADLYLPKADDDHFSPDNDDMAFARAFAGLAEVVESSANPEELLLRLSTCRNAYMTVNTLFVALGKVLGHGQHPSRLAACCEHLLPKELAKLRRMLDEISGILKEFSKKIEVWDHRAELDAQLAKAIEGLPTQNDRFEIKAILDNLRTDINGHGRIDVRFLAISTAEPTYLAEDIQLLRRIHDHLVAYVKVLMAASELDVPPIAKGPTLFNDDASSAVGEAGWHNLVAKLIEGVETFRFAVDADATVVIVADVDRNPVEFSRTAPTVDDVDRYLQCLSHQGMELQERLHGQLLSHFRPNVARRPLPDLFKIDLTEQLPSDNQRFIVPRVTVLPLGGDKPATFTLALPTFGFPADWYRDDGFKRFKDSKTDDAERVLEHAINSAAENHADVIVLPEYAIPRKSERRLTELSRKKRIALIGGLEASTEKLRNGNLVVNEALIWLPEVNDSYRQSYSRKRSASVYESALAGDERFELFKGTRLGTFAVIVCSDFREMDVLAAYANVDDAIDCIFVCSMNPHPELFEQLAIADAHRFHSCVVMSNNRFHSDNQSSASSEGSGVFWPKRELAEQITRGTSRVDFPLANVGGSTPGLLIQEVPISDLVRTTARPPKGFLPCPRSRLLKDKG